MYKVIIFIVAITIAGFATVMNASAQTQDGHKQHHKMAGMFSKSGKSVKSKRKNGPSSKQTISMKKSGAPGKEAMKMQQKTIEKTPAKMDKMSDMDMGGDGMKDMDMTMMNKMNDMKMNNMKGMDMSRKKKDGAARKNAAKSKKNPAKKAPEKKDKMKNMDMDDMDM